ncbi:hypothetical protein BU187_16240, partial [Enterococcus faecium]
MKKKITITAMSLLTALFLLPINGFAYTINNEFNLGANEGSSQVANNQYILLHETANETATGLYITRLTDLINNSAVSHNIS